MREPKRPLPGGLPLDSCSPSRPATSPSPSQPSAKRSRPCRPGNRLWAYNPRGVDNPHLASNVSEVRMFEPILRLTAMGHGASHSGTNGYGEIVTVFLAKSGLTERAAGRLSGILSAVVWRKGLSQRIRNMMDLSQLIGYSPDAPESNGGALRPFWCSSCRKRASPRAVSGPREPHYQSRPLASQFEGFVALFFPCAFACGQANFTRITARLEAVGMARSL